MKSTKKNEMLQQSRRVIRQPAYRSDQIGLRLRSIRESVGVSQTEFAYQAGISEKSYWQYEAQHCYPPIQKLVDLANAWDFDLTEVLQ